MSPTPHPTSGSVRRPRLTLRAALRTYRDHLLSGSSRSLPDEHWLQALARWSHRFGTLPLTGPGQDEWIDYFVELAHKDYPYDLLYEEWTALDDFYAWARGRGWVDGDPSCLIPVLEAPALAPSVSWTAEEQTRLLQASCYAQGLQVVEAEQLRLPKRRADAPTTYLHPMLLLGLHTGVRLGNLLYLEWRHLPRSRTCTHLDLPAAEVRTARRLRIRLSRSVTRMLDLVRRSAADRHNASQPPNTERVFVPLGLPCLDEQPDPLALECDLLALCRFARVPEGGFPSARESFVGNCVRRGLPFCTIAQLVDWEDPIALLRSFEEHAPPPQVVSHRLAS